MSRRPSFQFYPADWRGNAKLRRCSRAERGDWIELICLLHDSEEYGALRWPLKDIAQAIGCQVSDLKKGLIAKDVLKGADEGERCQALIYRPRHSGKDGDPVTLIAEQDGPIWYSSRMVRDEYIRTNRATKDQPDRQPKGGFGTPEDEHQSRARARLPAQSSSSSSSASTKPPSAGRSRDTAMPDGFEEFWQIYPRRGGDNPKQRALRAFKARIKEGHSIAQIVDGTRRYATYCRAGDKEDTEFVKLAATFLGPEKPFLERWTVPNGKPHWGATNDSIYAKAQELNISTRGETTETLRVLIRERLSASPSPH